jgi:carbamate kinase
MRLVVALGGNALLERGERPDAAVQQKHVRHAARSLAVLAAEHQLIICHGNGPQIGQLAMESEADADLSRPYPLEVLVAETQGMIGYWLMQELEAAGVTTPVNTLVTRIVVNPHDPAFAAPTKFIGPVYTERQMHRLARRHGWTVAQDGAHWRRVVASPLPRRLVEIETVMTLLDAGSIVICGGGGGIPVAETDHGFTGVEAVVDKDFTAAMIAADVAADRLLIMTDVSAVMSGFGTPRQQPISHLSLEEIDHLQFPPGSMGPKVAACRRFAVATGHAAAIGSLDDAVEVLAGNAGTTIGPH